MLFVKPNSLIRDCKVSLSVANKLGSTHGEIFEKTPTCGREGAQQIILRNMFGHMTGVNGWHQAHVVSLVSDLRVAMSVEIRADHPASTGSDPASQPARCSMARRKEHEPRERTTNEPWHVPTDER